MLLPVLVPVHVPVPDSRCQRLPVRSDGLMGCRSGVKLFSFSLIYLLGVLRVLGDRTELRLNLHQQRAIGGVRERKHLPRGAPRIGNLLGRASHLSEELGEAHPLDAKRRRTWTRERAMCGSYGRHREVPSTARGRTGRY